MSDGAWLVLCALYWAIGVGTGWALHAIGAALKEAGKL